MWNGCLIKSPRLKHRSSRLSWRLTGLETEREREKERRPRLSCPLALPCPRLWQRLGRCTSTHPGLLVTAAAASTQTWGHANALERCQVLPHNTHFPCRMSARRICKWERTHQGGDILNRIGLVCLAPSNCYQLHWQSVFTRVFITPSLSLHLNEFDIFHPQKKHFVS